MDDTFTIEKLGGSDDPDEALLRFVAPLPRMAVVQCYLDNDQLANLAHVFSKFVGPWGRDSTSYPLGSFAPMYAGGALLISLKRDGAGIMFTCDMLDEHSKGSEAPERLTAEVTKADIEAFAISLRALHAADSGVAQLRLTLQRPIMDNER